jgi:hypothetical protein
MRRRGGDPCSDTPGGTGAERSPSPSARRAGGYSGLGLAIRSPERACRCAARSVFIENRYSYRARDVRRHDGRGHAGGKGFVDQSPHDRCRPLSARVSSRCSVRWCRGRSLQRQRILRQAAVLSPDPTWFSGRSSPWSPGGYAPLPASGGPCDARSCPCLCRGGFGPVSLIVVGSALSPAS